MPDDLAPPPGSDRDWHWRDQEPDEKPLPPETERRVRLMSAFLIFAVLVGLIIGLGTWLMSSPSEPRFFLSLAVVEHSDPLYPPHPFALDDRDAIMRNFPAAQVRKAEQSQTHGNFTAELGKLAKQKDGPIIVHISCQARTRGDTVYLLPSDADADPDKREKWLSLQEVLKSLNDCPAPQKLLLLDIVHPLADPRLGIVCDDVAEGVRKTLEKTPESPSLFVLNTCSPGQTGLTSPVLGRSVFAHFVDQGLRGDADDWGPAGKKDKRIYVKELAAYVRHQAERWADKNRAAKQMPWLWGDGTDFMLVDRTVPAPPEKKEEVKEPDKEGQGDAKADPKKDEKKDEKKEPPPKFEYPAPLKTAWALRDKLASRTAPPLSPALVLRINLRLLQIERDWRGDRAKDKADLNAFVQQMKKLDADLDDVAKQAWRPNGLLVLATMAYAEPDAKLLKELEDKLKEVTVAAAKDRVKEKDVPDKVDSKFIAEVSDELMKLLKDQKEPMQKVATVLKTAGKLGPTNRLQIAVVRDALDKLLKGEPNREAVETIWLQRLKAFDAFLRAKDNQDAWKWPDAEVGQALRTLLTAEEVCALLVQEPELLPWLDEDRFRQAEEARRQGEGLLFWGKLSERPEAAAKLEQAQGHYEALKDALSKARSALSAHHEALVLMPGCFQWLDVLADPELNKNEWQQAQLQLENLSGALASKKTPGKAPVIDGSRLIRDLELLAVRLRDSVDKHAQVDIDQPARALAVIAALRASAALTAAERARLWQTAHQLADDLHTKFQPATAPLRQVTLSALPRGDDWQPHVTAGKARAKLALDLLTLAKAPELDAAHELLKDIKDELAPPEAFEKLGASLRAAWWKLRDDKAAPNAAADCFKFLLPVAGERFDPNEANIEFDPRRWNNVRTWLSSRYVQEAEFLEAQDQKRVGGNAAFFRKLAVRLKQG